MSEGIQGHIDQNLSALRPHLIAWQDVQPFLRSPLDLSFTSQLLCPSAPSYCLSTLQSSVPSSVFFPSAPAFAEGLVRADWACMAQPLLLGPVSK